MSTTYAVIAVGGKQYRVREGERLLVDRLAEDEGATVTPRVLLVGGDGETRLSPDVTVTATVLGERLGEKIRIGKYKAKKGYRKHTGFRAKLTELQIESIGGGSKRSRKAEEPQAKAPAKAEAATAEPQAQEQEETVERVKGMPSGYEELTVAQIKDAASGWNRPMLEAALEYERAGQARKGAIAALESALADKEES